MAPPSIATPDALRLKIEPPERTHRQARSISYRIGGAKFPVLKDIHKFVFADSPVDEGQVRELATGTFLEAKQRNLHRQHRHRQNPSVHLRGFGGYPHPRQGRFFNLVDLVNQEKAAGRSGRLSAAL